MKFLKKIKPGTWVTAAILAFVLAVASVLIVPNWLAQQKQDQLNSAEATIGLYNNHDVNRKLNERVEIAIRLNLKDTTTGKYPIQLEGRGAGAWQVIKSYTATKPDNTVVFRVHPGRLGDIIYRAEIKTKNGIVTTNELTLHISK
ncbi:MAG: hypothetical protein EBT82_04585 [Micrococcales bacterium]|nr:hypothetical protein [Micrococcales bacterium]NBR61156.1 hypothetical protein [Actinomycetota bacterium]NBR55226.1 hypothetical protein [Micrococcales bacterium]NBT47615.1 hypothetical protein [Actinomycetota bacterium]NBY43320.1 hypothetical protein [Micrococcales bacterium]